MNIGIPKERRPYEFRVGLSPAGVEMLAQSGHKVFVESEAGLGAGFNDAEFEKAGARLVYSSEEVCGRSDFLLKVAWPLKEELDWIRPGAILAGFLHLASAQQDKIDVLLKKKITSVAYEQIRAADGSLPVLHPFSQIGGAMAAQIAARFLQSNWGGNGIFDRRSAGRSAGGSSRYRHVKTKGTFKSAVSFRITRRKKSYRLPDQEPSGTTRSSQRV